MESTDDRAYPIMNMSVNLEKFLSHATVSNAAILNEPIGYTKLHLANQLGHKMNLIKNLKDKID